MSIKSLIPKRHAVVEDSDDDDDSMSSMSEFVASSGTGSGRKRKLDHLTWEEKVQRKKLKNRVAAQTSRDRKKKQMEEMQTTIDIQAKQISSLQVERDRIKVKYEKLEEDCQKLKLRLDMQDQRPNIVKNNIPEEHKYNRSLNDTERCCSVGFGTIKTEGSAESHKPLLKVTMEPESTKQQPQKNSVQALMKIIALCLLYRTSSKTSTCQNSKNLQRVYSQMSQQTWKQVIQEAAQQLPKLKANNSDCLNQWWGPASQEWNPPKIAVGH